MIQRVQTIFLLLISVLAILMLYLNISFFENNMITGERITVGFRESIKTVDGASTVLLSHTFLQVCTTLLSTSALVAIFFFKNRKRQLMICSLNYLLIILQMVGVYMAIEQVAKEFLRGISTGSFVWGIGLPVLLLILNLLAWLRIKKDEALLKSLDRIR